MQQHLAAVCVLATALAAIIPQPTRASSTLIVNATVLDGTGSAPARAAVRIAAGRIAEIGNLTPRPGEALVDGAGLTLAPGFIDTHSHHDRGLFDAPDALAAVSQGITTIVVGQDGSSALPLAEFFGRVEKQPAAVNVASYVGHGTLRRQVLGTDFKRRATADEIARMAALLRQEMSAGGLGLSTGLEYDPGIYSDPEELIALAKAAATLHGRYMSHIRSEDRKLFAAVDEVIRIGREARLPVQISHLKLAMRGLWGQADKLVGALDAARASGVNITADIYPYTYWQSGMTVLFPDRDFTNRAEAEFVLRELVTPEDLLIVGFRERPEYVGKTVAHIASLRGMDPAATVMKLIEESHEQGPTIVATSMDERDVARLMQWPWANICSDGTSSGGHPRGFGSFPRILGRYVRTQGTLTLPEAIRKMTSLSAANVGLTDRGTIAPGKAADLVLFDPQGIADRATTADATAMSVGIRAVWVNGDLVFDKGTSTHAHPGHVLRMARDGRTAAEARLDGSYSSRSATTGSTRVARSAGM
jgi:N-acyl-D-amino-acid deacylase